MDVKTVVQPLLRWWWLIVIAAGMAGISSFLVVRNDPPQYRSRAALMVGRVIEDPNPTGNEVYLSQQLAQAYADMASREPLREATREELGMDWLPEYAVRAVPNTQVIEIYVTDYVPARAQAVAAELSRQLILRSPAGQLASQSGQTEFVSDQLAQLEAQIRETEAEIESKRIELGELFSAAEIDRAQQEIQALETKLRAIQSNYALLLSNSQEGFSNALTLIEPATLPSQPLSSSMLQNIAVAVLISAALAVGAAYLLEFVDNTVRTPEGISRLTSLPLLGIIGDVDTDAARVPALHQPRSPVVEAFRALRTGILLSAIDETPRRLLVTSPAEGDGKSMTTANLAVVLAQADRRVLLIDSDLRRPTLHRYFGVPNEEGLTELFLMLRSEKLVNGESVDHDLLLDMADHVTRQTDQPGLFLLTAGTPPPNPSELLGSRAMGTLLDSLLHRYDIVLMDSPPVLAVTDAAALSSHVDQVLLVVRAAKTRRAEVRRAGDMLAGLNAPVAGLVMNGYRPAMGSDYYYYGQPYASDEPVAGKGTSAGDRRERGLLRRLLSVTRSLLN